MIKIGYTHYWYIKKKPFFKNFKSALYSINNVLEQHKNILQFEADDSKPPLITENSIRFNGIGKDSYETFLFEFPIDEQSREYSSDESYHFDCCKTAEKPYDIVVCKILLILKAHLGDDIKIKSDGFSNDTKEFYGTWSNAISELVELGFKFITQYVPIINSPYFECKILLVESP